MTYVLSENIEESLKTIQKYYLSAFKDKDEVRMKYPIARLGLNALHIFAAAKNQGAIEYAF